MPLYDCVMLFKPQVKFESVMDLMARVGRHVCRRNGVITDVKTSRTVQLGYGVRKLDGRYYQGQLMQMTMMATPNINKELQYLNKEDRLLRWIVVKHRDPKYSVDYKDDNHDESELSNFRNTFYDNEDTDEDDEDEDDEDEDDDDDIDDEYDMDRDNKRSSDL